MRDKDLDALYARMHGRNGPEAALQEELLRDARTWAEAFASFNETMSRVFPGREIVEIENRDQIFHTVYDLDDRYQILGEWSLGRGGTGWMKQSRRRHARGMEGIYDDHNRLMVAMFFNSDVSDS